MADLTQTAASFVPSASATIVYGTAGATIAAGQPVYEDTADLDSFSRPKLKLADANGSSPAALVNGVRGLAANGAAAGQLLGVVVADPAVAHGLTGVVKGDIIILSATPGTLAPAADMATGMRPSVCLVATSTTLAVLSIINGGVAK